MSGKLISTNPAKNYETIGEVDISTETEIKEKVAEAQKAKLAWKETPIEKRISYFEKLMVVYKKRNEEIARLQTEEIGKPIKQSTD